MPHEDREPEEDWETRLAPPEHGDRQLLWCRGCDDDREIDPAIYSITSSARTRTGSGIVMPNAFAVLRLIASANVAAR